jgi:hypothetical protein
MFILAIYDSTPTTHPERDGRGNPRAGGETVQGASGQGGDDVRATGGGEVGVIQPLSVYSSRQGRMK